MKKRLGKYIFLLKAVEMGWLAIACAGCIVVDCYYARGKCLLIFPISA